MQILFALIMINGTVFYPGGSIRIGAYEKLQQCQEQGHWVADHAQYRTTFLCVPVNR